MAADLKDRAALEATLRFIEEKVKPRRCDSDGVSGCWRCQSVYLAARMRELLAERDANGVPVLVPVLAAFNPARDQGPCTVCGVPWAKHGTAPTCASHDYTPAGPAGSDDVAASAANLREAMENPIPGYSELLPADEDGVSVSPAPAPLPCQWPDCGCYAMQGPGWCKRLAGPALGEGGKQG